MPLLSFQGHRITFLMFQPVIDFFSDIKEAIQQPLNPISILPERKNINLKKCFHKTQKRGINNESVQEAYNFTIVKLPTSLLKVGTFHGESKYEEDSLHTF